MFRLIFVLIYLLIFIPIWAVRHIFGISRFERLFHMRDSTWDNLRRKAESSTATASEPLRDENV